MHTKSLLLKKTFHFVFLLFLIILILWDRIINIPKFPYCFCYLTQMNLYLNTIYYLLSLVNDFKWPKSKSLDKYYHFCFVLSFCVFIMFWGLFFWNRNTLFKKGIELSYLLIFLLHGGVFFICLCEQLYINSRNKPQFLHQIVFVIFAIIYSLFLRLIYNLFKIKVYPFVYGSFYLFIIIILVGWLVSLIGHSIYYFLSNRRQLDNKANDTSSSREMKEELKA